MNYESLEQALQKLAEHQQTMAAYGHAMGVLFHDAASAAPSDSWEGRGQTMGVLSKITYDLETSPELDGLLTYLEGRKDELTDQQRREVEVLRKGYSQMQKIPAEEYVEYSVLLNNAQNI